MEERNNIQSSPLEKARQAVAKITFFISEVRPFCSNVSVFEKLLINLKDGKIQPEEAVKKAEKIYKAITEIVFAKQGANIKGANEYEIPTINRIMDILSEQEGISFEKAVALAMHINDIKQDYH